MSDNKASSSISFGGLLTIVFITLKLTGYIDWSWWIVTMPLWAGLAIIGVILAVVFTAAVITFGVEALVNWTKKP